mgnify:CR=1 FL=1
MSLPARPRKRFGQHFLEPAWVARLIEAMAKLRADGHDVTLTVIGRAKPGKSLDLIEQLQQLNHLLPARVNTSQLPQLLLRADPGRRLGPARRAAERLVSIEVVEPGIRVGDGDGTALVGLLTQTGNQWNAAQELDAKLFGRALRALFHRHVVGDARDLRDEGDLRGIVLRRGRRRGTAGSRRLASAARSSGTRTHRASPCRRPPRTSRRARPPGAGPRDSGRLARPCRARMPSHPCRPHP